MKQNFTINKVGIVATTNVSVGGGYQKVFRDLVNALNLLGKKVYVMTPYRLDYKKIEILYGPLNIENTFYPSTFRSYFCKETVINRILMKNEFIKMCKMVDLIIDIDGGVLHKYLPPNFNTNRYIIWKVSCGHSRIESNKFHKIDFKRKLKNFIKAIFMIKDIKHSRDYKIYPIDEWTRKALIKYWNVEPQKFILYPQINVDEFKKKKPKKKKQIVIFGRFSPNKLIENSIKIFALGTENFPEYKLVIMGGLTPDSENYISFLKKVIVNYGIKDKVIFIVDPTFKQLKKVLIESDILIDSQRDISLTLTSIEALACGMVVLAYKNGGTFKEVLQNGKYGFGFMSVKEGSEKLNSILKKIKNKSINRNLYIKRAKFFSPENFIKRVKKIIDDAI